MDTQTELNDEGNGLLRVIKRWWGRFVFFRNLPKETHQLKNSTSYDRYPELFSVVRQYYLHKEMTGPILSYGCSTGEECFSLRENYFPDAPLVGVDIDRENLEKCEQNNGERNIKFLYSDKSNLSRYAPYQVIFCMSVLCRWPDSGDIDDISSLYPFRKFEKKCRELHEQLKLGGLLVIYNSNFKFSDTSLYTKYSVIKVANCTDSGFVHKFGTDNKKLLNQEFTECIFVKTSK